MIGVGGTGNCVEIVEESTEGWGWGGKAEEE